MTHRLVVRLDSLGDMIVCGPAVRAVAAASDQVSVLAGPDGAAAARLLPGVDDVLTWSCPWILADPPPVRRSDLREIVARLTSARIDEALILTSFHQSALPVALLLRLAGVDRIAGVSEDYPGQLLDVRIAPPPPGPEPQRMLAIAADAGYRLPEEDDGRLAVRPGPPVRALPRAPFLVVHPGVTAPARSYPDDLWADVVAALTTAGWTVLITGTAAEAAQVARLAGCGRAPGRAVDVSGRFDLAGLAEVLRAATAVLVANTGPAHLTAAVGTPIVSLFAPVVDAEVWAPYGVPTVVLGDQRAACRGSRARVCPVPGHPCLSSVSPAQVVAAVDTLLHRDEAASA
jgi:ADP-heptose:LPS heptosyltransferase